MRRRGDQLSTIAGPRPGRRATPQASRTAPPPLERAFELLIGAVCFLPRDQNSDEPAENVGYDFGAWHEDWKPLATASGASNVLICVDLFQKWPTPAGIPVGAEADHFRLDVLDRLRRDSICLARPDGFSMLILSEGRRGFDSAGHRRSKGRRPDHERCRFRAVNAPDKRTAQPQGKLAPDDDSHR